MPFFQRHILSGMDVIEVKANNVFPAPWYRGIYMCKCNLYFLTSDILFNFFGGEKEIRDGCISS